MPGMLYACWSVLQAQPKLGVGKTYTLVYAVSSGLAQDVGRMLAKELNTQGWMSPQLGTKGLKR
jgi:hypothetical protein